MFDDVDREATGAHRGSRWNKYKFGRTSPDLRFLQAVEKAYQGTLNFYNHPVWTMASGTSMSNAELGECISRMPREISRIFAEKEEDLYSSFWVRPELNHRDVIKTIFATRIRDDYGYFQRVAVLLAFIRDAALRQREAQHFESHVALARLANSWYKGRTEGPTIWRMEAFVFLNFVNTRYRKELYKRVVQDLSAITQGDHPPWLAVNMSLELSKGNSVREELSERDKRGYWIGAKLAHVAQELGFSQDGQMK
jgi:hypothetical protein